MEINELLDRYFEGDTSGEEERRLRAFFTSDEVPPELAIYKSLFTFWEEEAKLKGAWTKETEAVFRQGIPDPDEVGERIEPAGTESTGSYKRKKTVPLYRQRALYAIAGLAASVFLVLGLRQLVSPVDPCFCAASYVVIDGRCYTDVRKVRLSALQALQEVGTPADAYFPEEDGTTSEREIIDEQLNELCTLFNEND